MNAKQTAMKKYGLKVWPESHNRSKADCDCRGYACVLMRDEGYSKRNTAKVLGFQGGSSVTQAIRRYELQEGTSHLGILVKYLQTLEPVKSGRRLTD